MEEVLVRDAVAYLARRRPKEIERLRENYTGRGEQAMLELELGPLPVLLAAQIEVATVAVDDVVSRWREIEHEVRGRITKANRWEQYGAVGSLIGSSSVLAMILINVGGEIARFIAALLATTGAFTVLQRKYMMRDLLGEEGGLPRAFRDLAVESSKAASVKRQLTPYLMTQDDGGDQEHVQALLRDANSLVTSMEASLAVVTGHHAKR